MLNWLPCVLAPEEKEPLWRRISSTLERLRLKFLNGMQLWLFMALVLALNIVLFASRANQFVGMRNVDGESQNYFYNMISRACGKKYTMLRGPWLEFIRTHLE